MGQEQVNYRRVENIYTEKRQPRVKRKCHSVVVRWTGRAENVSIVGSWNKWKEEIPLNVQEDRVFVVVLTIPEGKQFFRFLVDGDYAVLDTMKKVKDGDGHYSNEVLISEKTTYIPPLNKSSRLESGKHRERLRKLPNKPPKVDFEDGFSQKPYEFLETKKTPPQVPPHMMFTPLKVRSDRSLLSGDNTLPVPLHVTINHIYFNEKEMDGLKVIGITNTCGPFEDKKYTTIQYFFSKDAYKEGGDGGAPTPEEK